MTGESGESEADVVRVETTEQLRAVSNLVRHRILAVLRDGPATITQIAERLGLAKGSSSHHVRTLERAGLIKVVRTNKVRGVVERYYAHAARRIVLPEPAPGQSDVVMGHALADLAEAPENSPRLVRMQHTRISEAKFEEFSERLRALLDEIGEARDSEEDAASVAVMFFRPRDPGSVDAT
ncbi:ArsR/SmtB family transcription factor [Amycolatopsis sp. NPDC058986]|uniref:ArsR/SmtB family transcription factor n=1 Tax=unclassified Amycolatopsis TaxID=2618356 RepID=UPI00366EC4B6